jgi:hypothetical protein
LVKLDEFLTIIQSVLAFLAGSGLTGLAIFWYEKRERRREKAIDRFLERVLTQDFFSFESLLWDLCNLYRMHDKLKKGEIATCVLEGAVVTMKDETDWNRTLTRFLLKCPRALKRLQDTGVMTLAPKKIRLRIADIGLRLTEFKKQMTTGQDISELAQKIENQLRGLSRDIRDIIGTYRL